VLSYEIDFTLISFEKILATGFDNVLLSFLISGIEPKCIYSSGHHKIPISGKVSTFI